MLTVPIHFMHLATLTKFAKVHGSAVNSVAMHEAISCSTPQFLVTNLNIAKSALNILSVNKI